MNKENRKQIFIKYAILSAVSLAALYIRCLGLDVISGDFQNCLNVWHLEIENAGPGLNALLHYTGDYAMPYAFVIWLLGKLPMPFLYSLKGFHILFDFLLAVMAGKIVKKLKPASDYGFCLGYGVTLLLPNVIFNSSFWGQSDGLCAAFLLAAFYYWLEERYRIMMLMFGIAFSFKLQAVFFLPFLMIVYWQGRKFSVLHFLLIPLIMLVMNIPAMMAGYPPSITFAKYIGQTGEYPWLYYFYPNLWFFFQARPYYLFGAGAMLLTVSALLLFVVILIRKGVVPNRSNGLAIALWSAYTCCFFLPSMHERYGYFCEILAVLLALIHVRSLWLPMGMVLCVLPKYLYAFDLAGNPRWLQGLEAGGNTLLYLVFTCLLWQNLFRDGDHASEPALACQLSKTRGDEKC